MEAALIDRVVLVVVGYTGYRNAVGAASRALRHGWTEAKIVSPKIFVFSGDKSVEKVLAYDLRKCTWTVMAPYPYVEHNFFFRAGDAIYVSLVLMMMVRRRCSSMRCGRIIGQSAQRLQTTKCATAGR